MKGKANKEMPQQAKPHQPRMHQHVIVVEDMGTTRQGVIEGIKLNFGCVFGFQKGMFSNTIAFLHLLEFNDFVFWFSNGFQRVLNKMNQ